MNMKLKVLGSEDTSHNICESFLVSEILSFGELIALFHECEEKHKGCAVLLTLDDLSQAQYTSMHATGSHDLDNTEGHDLSEVDPRAFEDGEHIGHLSTKSEFFIRKKNFERKIENASFADACGRGLTIKDEELTLLESVHKNPMEYIDSKVIIKIVPVEKSYFTIGAFPNGYFTSDLNPFENYSVAKQLSDKYGYKLFGLGASLLGFIRDNALNENEALLLADDLAHLYNQNKSDQIINRLTNLAKANNFLFLKYVDYLEG